jgi:spore coat polysaccharide biosynthesis protein SpsF (cytidylyltransferase family)
LDTTIGEAEAFHRAHVTSAIPDCLTVRLVDELQPPRPAWRWTVDTAADLQMAQAAFELFGDQWPTIQYGSMVAILDERPDITSLNRHVPQKALEES